MKMYILILSMFLLHAKVDGQGPMMLGQCDTVQIDACLAPIFLDPASLLGQKLPDEMLASICGNMTNAKNCFDQKAKNCLKSELVKQKTNIDVVNYICTDEGKKGLNAAVNCSTTQSFMEYFYACNQNISSKLSADVSIIGNICKQNNALYSCYVNSSKICNLESFMTTFYKKLQYSQLEIYGCDLDFRNWETKVYSQCNMTKLPECLQLSHIPDIMQFIQNPLDLKLLSATPDQVNKTCSAVDALFNCVTKIAKCEETNPSLQSYLGMAKAHDYLCKTDRSGFDKLAVCYANNTSMFTLCMKSTLSNCSSFMTFQKCLTDTSKKTCGNSSTIDNYFYKNFQPILNQTVGGCLLIPPTKPSTVTNEAVRKIQSIFLIFLISVLIYYA